MARRVLTAHDKERLVAAARAAREPAYAVYSKYRVGAAVMAEGGSIYAGCNVENGAYPLGTCAEAGAIAAMVLDGKRTIRAVAVVGGRTDDQHDSEPWGLATPCGGCRQRIAEFAEDGETSVLIATPEAILLDTTIGELLPHAFNLKG